jgi:dinuclear metal center YbgI/SA1388 family protein
VAFLFSGGGELKLESVLQKIERLLPLEWAEEWDNAGLLSGDPNCDVSRVSVALDATVETVIRSAEKGCNLLVTHHPAFITPLRRVTKNTVEGAVLSEAISKGVALYGIHTNWDVSPVGVNRVLSEKAGLKNTVPLMNGTKGAWGIGAIGDLPLPLTLSELAAFLREAWNLSWMRVDGEPSRLIKRLGLCGGAGGDFIEAAALNGADAFATADLRYHEALAGRSSGLSLLVCDHGEMESASLDKLTELIISATGLSTERLPKGSPSVFFDLRSPGSFTRSDSR